MPDWKKLLDDAASQVEEGIKVAGSAIGEMADDAKKAAAIGIGTLEFELHQPRYAMGDSVTGVLKIRLAEPLPAKRLVVALRATRRSVRVGRRSDGSMSPVRQRETLHDFECELGGEKTYESGEHHFAVHIPDELDPTVDVDGVLGDALRAAQTLKSMTESPVKWTLVAFLDRPWKRNLTKEIDLAVV